MVLILVEPKKATRLNLKDNPFVTENGVTRMPSLVSEADQRSVDIKQNFYINGYVSKVGSVRAIKDYSITDDFRPIFANEMDEEDKYWLNFIARFSSVQNMQLLNQVNLTNKVFRMINMWKNVNRLQRLGLIQRWLYHHPLTDEDVGVYTLTGNGYRFMETFYPDDHYFNPMRFWTLPSNMHLRFWQMVDVYQVISSLPAFHGYHTMFNGFPREGKMISSSPLQVALEIEPGHIVNLVFYSLLETDYSDYYKDACQKWSKLTNAGNNTTFEIPDLPHGQGITNAIAFYAPTYDYANKVATDLEMANWGFSSIFLVGEDIKAEGIVKAFYMPDRATSNLVRLQLPFLVKEK